MKIEMSPSQVVMFERMKNKMLLYDEQIFVITDFKIEYKTITTKNFLGKTKTEDVRLLTSININAYIKEGEFVGVLTDKAVIHFLFYNDNLYQLYKNWKDFKEQLKAFGFTIAKINEYEDIKKEVHECLNALTYWDDNEFKDGHDGHKVGNMRPMILIKNLLNKLK